MKSISAARFKEQCLALLDEVDPEGIVVTKRGRPVARLIPFERGGGALIGALKGKLRREDELLSTGTRWRASAEP